MIQRFIHLANRKSLRGLGEVTTVNSEPTELEEQRETVLIVEGGQQDEGDIEIPNSSEVSLPSLASVQASMSQKSAIEIVDLVNQKEGFDNLLTDYFKSLITDVYGCFTSQSFFLYRNQLDPNSLDVKMVVNFSAENLFSAEQRQKQEDLFTELLLSVDFNSPVFETSIEGSDDIILAFEYASSDPKYTDIGTSNPYSLINELFAEAFTVAFGMAMIDDGSLSVENLLSDTSGQLVNDVIKIANTAFAILVSTDKGQAEIGDIINNLLSSDAMSYLLFPKESNFDIFTDTNEFAQSNKDNLDLAMMTVRTSEDSVEWLIPELSAKNQSFKLMASFDNASISAVESNTDIIESISDFNENMFKMIVELASKSVKSCVIDNLNLSSIDIDSRIADIITASNDLISHQLAYESVFGVASEDTAIILESIANIVLDVSESDLGINKHIIDFFSCMFKNNIAFQATSNIFNNPSVVNRSLLASKQEGKVYFSREIDDILEPVLNDSGFKQSAINILKNYHSDNSNQMLSDIATMQSMIEELKISLTDANSSINLDMSVKESNSADTVDGETDSGSDSTESSESVSISVYKTTLDDFTLNFTESADSITRSLESLKSLTKGFQDNYDMLIGVKSNYEKVNVGLSSTSKALIAISALAVVGTVAYNYKK